MSLCVYCRTSTRDILLYNFPEHEPTLRLWLQNMGYNLNWRPSKTDFLCSKHFLNNDKCSIPSIFNNETGKDLKMESPSKNTTIQNPSSKLSDLDHPANFSVCRICLAMDVKMYHISEHKLKDMYERLTSVEINTNEKLPQNLCWECAARLSSANKFREKALQTLCILLNRLEDDGVVNVVKNESKNANFHEEDTLSKENNKLALHREIDVTVEEVATDSYVFTYTEPDTCDDREIKNELVDLSDDFGCQNGNGVISNEKFALGCDDNESNNTEDTVVTETLKVVKQRERRTNRTKSSNGKKNKTLPCYKKLVVLLEDLRFNKHFHKQVADQLRKVDKNYSRINVNSKILDTASKSTNYDKKSLKKLFICDYCCKRVQHKHSLIRHIQIHHTENPIIIFNTQVKTVLNCSYCDFSTSKKYNLEEHINFKHTNKTVFSCSYCSFETYLKNTLKNHINAKHTKTNVFECAYCNYRANQKVHLVKHINAKHTKTTPFSCTNCNYTTYFKHALDTHVKIKHTKSNNYLCSYCDYKTHTKATLKLHINSKHTKSKIFNCSLCSYSSFNKSHLNRHINSVHTKAIYFNCSLCKYKAYLKSHLARHIAQVHNKKVVYNNCSYCTFKSSSKILLDEHINWKHTKTIEFSCSICSYKAYRQRDLTRHVIQMHDKLIITAMNNSGLV